MFADAISRSTIPSVKKKNQARFVAVMCCEFKAQNKIAACSLSWKFGLFILIIKQIKKVSPNIQHGYLDEGGPKIYNSPNQQFASTYISNLHLLQFSPTISNGFHMSTIYTTCIIMHVYMDRGDTRIASEEVEGRHGPSNENYEVNVHFPMTEIRKIRKVAGALTIPIQWGAEPGDHNTTRRRTGPIDKHSRFTRQSCFILLCFAWPQCAGNEHIDALCGHH